MKPDFKYILDFEEIFQNWDFKISENQKKLGKFFKIRFKNIVNRENVTLKNAGKWKNLGENSS